MANPIGTKWAIRQKSTGYCLPVAAGRIGRGGSFTEPCPFNPDKLTTHPRLFDTERGAQNCLSQWLRGKHHALYEYEENGFSGKTYRVDAGTKVEHIPTRVREDMEVIAVDIIPQ